MHDGKKLADSPLALDCFPVYRGFERYEAHGVSLGFISRTYNYHIIAVDTGTSASYVLNFGTESLSFGFTNTIPLYPMVMLPKYFSAFDIDVDFKKRFSIDHVFFNFLYLYTYLTKGGSHASILAFIDIGFFASVEANIFSELEARALPNPTVLIV